MRKSARWFLMTVLVIDLAFAAVLIADNFAVVGAQPDSVASGAEGPPSTDGTDSTRWDRDSLQNLGEQLARRAAELDRREAEIAELIRGTEVLVRAGLGDESNTDADAEANAEQPAANTETTDADASKTAYRDAAFERLQRAYANMNPETAASALSELATRDREAVVELLLSWQPRTSGAILDSLTQTNPGLAADLSYEIWKNGGKSGA